MNLLENFYQVDTNQRGLFLNPLKSVEDYSVELQPKILPQHYQRRMKESNVPNAKDWYELTLEEQQPFKDEVIVPARGIDTYTLIGEHWVKTLDLLHIPAYPAYGIQEAYFKYKKPE